MILREVEKKILMTITPLSETKPVCLLKEINTEYSLEGLILAEAPNILAYLMGRADPAKRSDTRLRQKKDIRRDEGVGTCLIIENKVEQTL